MAISFSFGVSKLYRFRPGARVRLAKLSVLGSFSSPATRGVIFSLNVIRLIDC